MKKSNANKVIPVIMSVAMCPMMLPTAAFAADDNVVSGEESSSPIELIRSSAQVEGADAGAISGATSVAQPEATGKAADATTGKTSNQEATNEAAAPAAETGGEGTAAAIAEVNNKSYSSLQAAIDAAQDGETVTLNADAIEDVTVAAGKNITLDLGDKALMNTNAGKATLTIAKGATATVKNGSVVGGTSYYTIDNYGTATFEGITATAGNTGSSMLRNDGTLTIESGTYAGGLNVVKSEEDSTLAINGGKFELSYATSGYTGVVFAYGNTTITGGEFVCSVTSTGRWNHPQVIATGMAEGHLSFTKITGGVFTNKYSDGSNIFRGVGKATSDNIEVSGGTFNKPVPSSYFADGLTCSSKNSDGTYGIATAIAQVGSSKYTSLQAAINAVKKAGMTVQLLNDTTENITIAAAKQITLDPNGHILNGGTGTAKATILNKGTLNIADTSADKTGTIKRDDQGLEGETSYYVIQNLGTMVIDQANVENNSGAKGSSLVCNGGDTTTASLTINGGTFEQQNFIAIKNDSNGDLTINGGTLTSKQSVIQNWNKAKILGGNLTGGYLWTDSWTEEGSVGETVIGGDAQFSGTIYMDVTSPYPSTLKIEGGSLDVTSWRVTPAAAQVNSTIAVSGGTFTAAVPENYCAAGYVPTTNAEGTYGVDKAVAVNFDSNQGSAVNPQFVVVGGKVAKPADPTKEGYTFTGWFTDEDCTKLYDFDAAVDDTVPEFTLYAGWKVKVPSTVEPGTGDNTGTGDDSSTVKPGTGDNGNNGGNGDNAGKGNGTNNGSNAANGSNANNGDNSSANENVTGNTVNNNGDKTANESKKALAETGDNLTLVGGAIALITVTAAAVAAFALRRRKMN